MTFEEALQALKDGKAVKRKEWLVEKYVTLKDNKIVDNNLQSYYIDTKDLTEDCWEEYKEHILTDKEKEYLSAVIKPFRDRVKYIYKTNEIDDCSQLISIYMERYDYEENLRCEYMDLPHFKKDTMYKGMETGKKYTLEELGL